MPVLVMAAVLSPIGWLAVAPDAAILLACCVVACVAAFPLARWLGVVDLLSPRRARRLAALNSLADVLVELASSRTSNPTSTRENVHPVPARFRTLVQCASEILSRRLPAAESRAVLDTELSGWITQRSRVRSVLLPICRGGPAIALGASMGMLVLMVEYWANPSNISSLSATGIGLLMVVSLLAMTGLTALADQFELAEATDQMAASVVAEAVRRIAAGESADVLRPRLDSLLSPRSCTPIPAELRKAA